MKQSSIKKAYEMQKRCHAKGKPLANWALIVLKVEKARRKEQGDKARAARAFSIGLVAAQAFP